MALNTMEITKISLKRRFSAQKIAKIVCFSGKHRK